ncbi:MAG: hypothetical protein SGARI_001601 [Bacillariaceae sp.]
MRLAIASAVLAQSLPASSLKEEALSFLSKFNQPNSENDLETPKSSGGFKLHARGHDLVIDKESWKDMRKQGGGIIKNLLRSQAKECDPVKAAHPDSGLLSCGVGRYCMESDQSNLGGLCQNLIDTEGEEGRGLQDDANTTIWEDAYTLFCEDNMDGCECSDVSMEDYTLSISCEFEDTCKPKTSKCNENIVHCYDATYAWSVTAPATYTRTFCYTDTQPYDSNICYTANVIDDDWTCEVSSGGDACSSCEVNFVDVAFCPPVGNCTYYTNFPCYTFDCTNTALNVSGNDCEQDGTPIFDYMDNYGCIDCSICGPGWAVTSPNGTILDNIPYQCWEVDAVGRAGYLTSDYCSGIQTFLQGTGNTTCGCEMQAPTEAPAPTAPSPITIPTDSGSLPPVPPVAQPAQPPASASRVSAVVAVGIAALVGGLTLN